MMEHVLFRKAIVVTEWRLYATKANNQSKLPKPKELKGIKQFDSSKYDGRCKCQLFLLGSQLPTT